MAKMTLDMHTICGENSFMVSMDPKCYVCDKDYEEYVSLRKHFKRRHSTDLGISVRHLRMDTNKPYNCSKCYNGYKNITSLKSHYLNNHLLKVQENKGRKKSSLSQLHAKKDNQTLSSDSNSEDEQQNEEDQKTLVKIENEEDEKSDLADNFNRQEADKQNPKGSENQDLDKNKNIPDGDGMQQEQQKENRQCEENQDIAQKRKLPEGYGISVEVLQAMKVMITSVDESLANDFSELKKRADVQ